MKNIKEWIKITVAVEFVAFVLLCITYLLTLISGTNIPIQLYLTIPCMIFAAVVIVALIEPILDLILK